MEYSKNERAGKLTGFRPDAAAIQEPSELGYRCPTCKNAPKVDGEPDERLTWSEYNAFLWCRVCNRDYLSCLCREDMDAAVEIFLDSVSDAIVQFVQRVNERAEMNMEKTGKLEGAHYAAMRTELAALKK